MLTTLQMVVAVVTSSNIPYSVTGNLLPVYTSTWQATALNTSAVTQINSKLLLEFFYLIVINLV